MHKGMIFFSDKGKALAQSFVEHAVKKYPSAFGLCVVDPADNLLTGNQAANPTTEAVFNTSSKLTEPGVLYYLGDHPEGSSDEDIQPFCILTDKEENPLLYAFITGSFPGSMKQGSSHSDHYHYSEDFLKKKFTELYEEVFEGDLAKIIKMCDTAGMRRDLMSGAVGPSCVTLMFNDGQIKTYVKDLEPIEYAFGWTTDDCNYKENIGEYPPKAVEEKKLPAALAKKNKNLISSAVAAVVKPIANVIPISPPKTETAVQAPQPIQIDLAQILGPNRTLGKDGRVYFSPDNKMHDKQLKKAYGRVAGFLPNNPRELWKTRPTVPISDAKMDDLMRAHPMLKAAVEATKAGKTVVSSAPKPATTTTNARPNTQPTTQPVPHSGGVPDAAKTVVPITSGQPDPVTEKVLENFMPYAKRFIDAHSNEIINPMTLQEKEERMLSYASSLGIAGAEATVRWPPEALKLLGQKSLDALVDLCLDYRLHWLRSMDPEELKKLNPTEAKPEKKLPAALQKKKM